MGPTKVKNKKKGLTKHNTVCEQQRQKKKYKAYETLNPGLEVLNAKCMYRHRVYKTKALEQAGDSICPPILDTETLSQII